MKQINKARWLVVHFALVIMLAACNGINSSSWTNNSTQGAYTNTYLPEKFSINIPASIKSQSSASSKKTGHRGSSSKELSYGYKHLKDQINKLDQFSAGFELQFMLVDKIYQDVDNYWNQQQQNNSVKLPAESLEVEFTSDIAEKFIAANANLDMTLRDYYEMKDIVGAAVGEIYKIPKKPEVDPYHIEVIVTIPAGSFPSGTDFYLAVSGGSTAIDNFTLGQGYWDGSQVSYVYYWGDPDQVATAVVLDNSYTKIAGATVALNLPESIFFYEKDANDVNSDGYQHIITYSGAIGPDLSHLLWDTGKKTTKIKWNTERNKIAVNKKIESTELDKSVIADSDLNAGKMSVKITEKYKGASSNAEFSLTINLEETGEKNGVKISSKEMYKYGTVQDSYEISGMADDDGGFISTTFKTLDTSTGFSAQYTYNESFNGTGELTGLTSNDPSTGAYNIGDPTQSEYYDNTGETYTMEAMVYIAITWPADLSSQIATINSTYNITIEDYFNYVVVLNGAPEPSVNLDEFMTMQVGYGAYNKTDVAMRWTNYWGTRTQIAGLKVYIEFWKDAVQQYVYAPVTVAEIKESTEAPDPIIVDPTAPSQGIVTITNVSCSGGSGYFIIMPDASFSTPLTNPETPFFDAQLGNGFVNAGNIEWVNYWGTPEQAIIAKIYCESYVDPDYIWFIEPAAIITVSKK